jgi:hypothetical protein
MTRTRARTAPTKATLRKGLFTCSRKAKRWEITAVEFLGDNATICRSRRHPEDFSNPEGENNPPG